RPEPVRLVKVWISEGGEPLGVALDRQAAGLPVAPRAGIESSLSAREREPVQRDARRDAGPAVGDDFALRELGEWLVPRCVRRARDPTRDPVDRIRLTAIAGGNACVDHDEIRIAEPRRELFGRDRVRGAGPRFEADLLDFLLAR